MTSPLAGFHPSNALTYLSLLASIGAFAAASYGGLSGAGVLVALSVIADTFDGAFARLFERDSRQRAFGAQLDSLSDAVAFGMVPVACATATLPSPPSLAGTLWWVACFLYVACVITRLGFYNVSHDEQTGFVGMPAPIAALVWSSTLLLGPSDRVSAGLFVVTAIAMVSPVRLPRPSGSGLMLFTLWPIVVGTAHVARMFTA